MSQEYRHDAEEVAGELQPPASAIQPPATRSTPQPLGHQPLQETISRAGEGNTAAATQLLTALNSPDPDAQARASAELQLATSPVLWERLVEFLAVGTWAGQPLDLPAAPSPEGRRLRRRVFGALLPQPNAPAEPVKQAALRLSLWKPLPEIQMVAVELLGRRGDRAATDDLTRALFDPALPLPVREHAALALGRLGGEAVVEALLWALREEHDVLSRFVTQALIRIGSAAVPRLIEALSSPDDNVRWHAAEALAEIGDPRAIEALVAVLGDHEASVRWYAAGGLIRLGKPAVAALLRALETRPLTPWLAQAAGHVLHHTPTPGPRQRLQRVIEALSHPTASVEVPVRAAEALAELA